MNRAKPWAHRSVLFLVSVFVGGIHPGCVAAEEPETPEQSRDPGDAHQHTNALIDAKSPYLLQHAHNPVHWLPWSDAAFAKAKKEGKPIFLSIGYSTCHWCHVMEKECFEDAEVAALLNRDFIAVKVDREERPDVDDVYMNVASALGSGNGWPLTIVMTPEGKPYFAGTYIPKHDRYGITGLMTRLPVLARQYRYGSSRMDEAMERVDRRLELFARRVPVSEVTIDPAALDHVFGGLMASYDSTYGGFGMSMKFPRPHQLLYLLRYHGRTGSEPAIAAVGHTLDRIRAGGIYDQVGFGLHRYATDRAWFVPHFEKMLYDQAQVAMAAAECYAATGEPKYRRMTEEIFTYVRRDLTSPEGAFYSAEDADSQGEEGKFYVWTAEQLQAILSDKQYEATRSVLGVEAEGNWFDHAARERQPTNILHVTDKGEAALAGASPEFRKDFEAARAILLEHRARRVRPSLDDKVMADSNGLMIAAFARGGRLLDEPAHVAAAAKAFDFVWENCRDDDRRLVHYWRGGPSPTPAYLDDYAFLAWGAVELYHATFDPKYLIAAGELVKKMNGSFWDEEEGGYFFTAHDAEKLLTRPKKFSDMALPSGNSVATLVLSELAQLTGDVSLEDRAARLEQLLARGALGVPSRYTQFAVALETRHATAYEAVVVGDPQAEDTRRMLALLREPRPGIHVAVLLKDVTQADNRLAEAAPFTREYRQQDGKATVYICRRQTCRQPTTDPAVVADYLK